MISPKIMIVFMTNLIFMFFVLFLKFIKSKIHKKWIFNELTIDHFTKKKKKTVTFAVKKLKMIIKIILLYLLNKT